MPRGRKKALTLDEQLAQTITEIEQAEKALEELKAKKEKLEEEIKTNCIAELYDLISARGLSIENVKELIDKGN